MLGFLTGISPWWWIGLAILLGAVEMLTVSTVLMGAAAAAAITGIVLWLVPALGGALQLAIFGLLAIALTFLGRAAFDRYGDGAAPTVLNQRTAQLIGREATVLDFAHAEGRIEIDGIQWPARLAPDATPPAPGQRVRIVASDGIVVTVREV